MDFVFNCTSCRGPLIARANLSGLRVQCAHCTSGIHISTDHPVTEALTHALLDTPPPEAGPQRPLLRRVRPAVQHSSAGASPKKPRPPRGARIASAV